jgi:hypothetical protein
MIPPATNALPRDLFRLITSTAIEVTSQVPLMLEDGQKEPGPGISPDPESFLPGEGATTTRIACARAGKEAAAPRQR